MSLFISEEGEYCTIGSPGSPVPTTICGPELKCMPSKDDDHPKCAKSMYILKPQYLVRRKCEMLEFIEHPSYVTLKLTFI